MSFQRIVYLFAWLSLMPMLGIAQTFYSLAGSKLILGGGTSGTTQLTLLAPSSAFTPYTITFPATTPTNTYLLQTNGSGQLSWVNPTSLGLLSSIVVDAPLSGSGTSASHLTFASQTANLVLASPDGSSGVPSFRALASADIPNLNTSKLTAGILPFARGGTGLGSYTLGDIIYYNGTVLTQLNGNTTATKLFLTQTGTGAVSAAPAWAGIVAADIPNLDASKITTGALTVARGGTGLSTLTDHGVLVGSGTNAIDVTAAGSAGQIFESGGSTADPSWVSAPIGIYGDGSDGSITFDGTTTILGVAPAGSVYTLARDIFPSSMTVNSGVTIKTNGVRIYCTGTITNNGIIQNNGNAAANNTAGAATTTTNILGSGQAGGAGGGTGGSTVAVAASAGGSGGVGGISGAGNAAGTVGGATAPTAANGGASVFHSFNTANTGFILNTTVLKINGGTGGSGGGGAAANTGGGGGGGGGVVLINAWKIANNNTISANGGAGGNGTGANAGSGGGGGGGLVLLIYHSFSGNAATATGGAAGSAKTGTGVLGSAGSNGVVVSLQN